ncbi:type II toxin-antitoxin system RelE/ParE family toxin [Prosthecochloris sp. SCSIO W1101]|uniref:type II toxin-antitoxin system RelE/ParE family toxin n=1 Tax=Prosthecochloris sp. SCSIO W1101 TaxID=2992242 RepID=UPI00223D07FC|nr:type II toxin-antitoxin system RelE/ParE family toxin [Prosthecochloris sp. SCSIO W1101]UZJ41281.1 type II toxin-antitoxin system RelE/ParE family toxin [Prosthecochloris sp. SCSIO W1101]
MNVVWTAEALRMLEEIERFIAQDNPQRASDFIDRLLEKGDTITSFPNMGRVVPELSQPEIREILVGKYRIVYKETPDHIVILTVFEGHRSLRFEELDP